VPSFTALMALALGAGVGLTWVEARRMGLSPAGVLDVAFAAVLVGVIAARAVYVAVNWDYFWLHTDEIAALWQGGLSWHGGLIGGVIGAVIVSVARKLPVRRTFDALTPGLMAGAALGWIGSFLAGVAYGREVFPGDRWWFLAADWPDVYGQWNPRFATQLLGAAWAMVCCVVAMMMSGFKGWASGVGGQKPEIRVSTFAVTMAVYSVGMFMLGFARGDAVPMMAGWRMDQVIDAGIVVASVAYILTFHVSRFTHR
jgi:phosphatidylglycerol:prolipoprotein diacylglycerol transferase